MSHQQMRRYVPLFLVSLFCVWIYGCSRDRDSEAGTNDLSVEQRTRDQLRQMIGSGREETREWRAQYLLPGLKSGLALLEEGKRINRPVLLAAGFLKDQQPVLFLAFLDPRFESRGIFLENRSGYRAQFRILEWTEEDKQWYSTMFRGIFVELSLPDESAKECTPEFSEDARRIAIPWVATQHEPKVGLLDGKGEETPSVRAYVDAFFYKVPPEREGESP